MVRNPHSATWENKQVIRANSTGWPKTVCHCQESLLLSNRIKNRQCDYISHQFWV